jgi:glycosyltransferase involved in cell wall biosynthesis
LIPRLVIVTEIIAPYRIPVFNALAERPEVDLHVIFLSETDATLRQWRIYKDEIKFQYDVLPSWRRRFGGHNLLLNRGMHSALSRIRPDAVLCGGYNYLACWQAAFWAQERHVPLLLWTESTAFDMRQRYAGVEFLKATFLEWCAAFVVPGRSSLDYLVQLGARQERVFTAPNAVDMALFSTLAGRARRAESEVRTRRSLPRRYFLYAGRLVRAKGVFDLLDAYAELDPQTRTQVGLVLVGDGEDRSKLMDISSRISPGTIQFAGFAQREELPEFYALGDALIFPTHSDPWGLVVNEAMACGLPVIVTDVAGCAADLVEDGWNGFVVPAGDSAHLASAMLRMADDSKLRTEMGSRSVQRIQEYSPAAWADGVITAVSSACSRLR